MKIVFINGKKRAGKDTFVGYCASSGKMRGNVRVHAISSIDPIRNMLDNLGADTSQKTPEIRAGMAQIGDILENLLSYRTKWCCEKAIDADIDSTHVLFIHMREPKLIYKLSTMLSDLGYKDQTKLFIRSDRGDIEADSNSADANVWTENFYDEVIENNGTVQDLSRSAASFMKKLVPALMVGLPILQNQHKVD